MPIGPSDYIDQMLAKKYSQEKVNNISEDTSRLAMSSSRYWEIQQDVAQVQRALLMVSTQFKKSGGVLKKAANPV